MNRLSAALLLALSLFLPSVALQAQEHLVPQKSGTVALVLSLGGAVAPWVMAPGADPSLLVALAVVGPSLGHVYAGRTGRGLTSAVVRAGALLGMVAGVALVWDDPEDTGGALLLFGGGAVFLGSTVYDVFSAPASAALYNRRHPVVGVMPVIQGGRARVALVARVAF